MAENTQTFEPGDIVVRLRHSCCSAQADKWYCVYLSYNGTLSIGDDKNDPCQCTLEWTLITKNNSKHMNIKEKFAVALTPEPHKTFRKLEITNGDNILTDDGVKIFLTWLLGKNQDAFKTEVCDPMLIDLKK